MLEALPGWVVSDAVSIRREMAALEDLTPEQCWEMALRCTRDALWALRLGDKSEAALAYQDPVASSTQAALERLPAEYRSARDA